MTSNDFYKKLKNCDYKTWLMLLLGYIKLTYINGVSLLSYASYKGHKDVVILLLNSGANINAKDVDGWTALMWANGEGNKEMADLLKKYGAK